MLLAGGGIAGAADVAPDPLYTRVERKLRLIDTGKLARGSVVAFSPEELNAWVRGKVPQFINGMREPRIELGQGTVDGDRASGANGNEVQEGVAKKSRLHRGRKSRDRCHDDRDGYGQSYKPPPQGNSHASTLLPRREDHQRAAEKEARVRGARRL